MTCTSGFKVKSLIAAGVSQLLSAANTYLISWVRAAQHQRGDPGSLQSQRAVQHHRTEEHHRTGLKSSPAKLGIIWDSESLQYHHRGQLKHLKTESVNTVKVLWSKTNFYFVFFSVTKNSLMMDQRNFWGQFATGGPLLRYFSNPLSCVSLKKCGCSNMYSASASCFSGLKAQ